MNIIAITLGGIFVVNLVICLVQLWERHTEPAIVMPARRRRSYHGELSGYRSVKPTLQRRLTPKERKASRRARNQRCDSCGRKARKGHSC